MNLYVWFNSRVLSVKHSIQRAIAHNVIKWEFLQAILRNECDGKKVTSMHLWIAVLYGDHKVTVHTPWCCSSHFMWSIKRQHWAQRIAIFNWQTKIENWNKNTTKQKWLRQKMLRLNIATDTKLNIMTKVSRPLRLDHRSNIWATYHQRDPNEIYHQHDPDEIWDYLTIGFQGLSPSKCQTATPRPAAPWVISQLLMVFLPSFLFLFLNFRSLIVRGSILSNQNGSNTTRISKIYWWLQFVEP